MLLKDQLRYLKRKYRFITPENCFYNNATELKLKTYSIIVHVLIANEQHGGFILKAKFNSIYRRTYNEWADYLIHQQKPRTKKEKATLKSKKFKLYPSITDVLKNNIINNHYGRDWKLLEIIGWQLLKEDKNEYEEYKDYRC